MMDVPDDRLLEQFARNGSEEAFAALVQRHIALVHSVALRHTANPQHAQDITQAVFVILARKAGALGRKTVLPGWLYHTARLTAANLQRAEARRVRREQEAFMQSKLEESTTDHLWRELSPQLDEAMAGLGTSERDALVLRYFQNKSMAEVGQLLGLAENTAQKRVSRALEKLRKFFTKRGVDSTTAAIAENISAHSVQAVPVALAKSVTAVALAKGATASASTLTLIKGALKIMAWSKAKTAIVVGVTILVTCGTTIIVKQNYFGEPRYQGVRLSEWVERISADSEARQTPMTDRDRAELTTAQDAVRHIGVRAIPRLLNWARATNEVGHPSMPAYQLARIGFQTLGPAAQSAVPGLGDLLADKSPLLRGNALVELASIGNGAADALPSVLNCLTNDPVPFIRYWAAGCVGNIGTNFPEQVIPILASLLNPTNDMTLRKNSMASLVKFQAQADQVVPILAGLLNSTNDLDTRISSLQYIARFRVQAKPAVPAIVACLDDESSAIRMAATNALLAIDREAATAAGLRVRTLRGRRAQ
jgi:RNA polymerase sigma factor (sigma-70 family)